MSESLADWTLRISGLDSFSGENIERFIEASVPFDSSGLSKEEWVVFVLYFAITRRSFDGKVLSKRDVMLVKAFQEVFTGLLKTLEFNFDVYWLYDHI